MVSGVPCDPRIGARGGHTFLTASFSPILSDGTTVAGDQRTYHLPPRLARRTAVTGLQTPTCANVKCSLTLAPAEPPDVAVVMPLGYERRVRDPERVKHLAVDRGEISRRVKDLGAHRRPVAASPVRQIASQRCSR